MQKLLFLTISVCLGMTNVSAQTGWFRGCVTDSENEPLYGVNVMIEQDDTDFTDGGITDFDGDFSFELKPGDYLVKYKYVGYNTLEKNITIAENDTIVENVILREKAEIIEEVVVSASKYEQKLSEVTVSMEVVKPKMIENTNTNDMEDAINKIPGVDVNDQQPSIRGGSGWSYGAGSRVLVLVDELPIIAADAGNVKWDYLPVENVSQVEVIKGASSVLYGSSAMNGVINLRTAYPTEKTQTKIIYNVGFYNQPGNPVKQLNGKTWDTGLYTNENFYQEDQCEVSVPVREEVFYWVNKPMFGGLSFAHQQQFGNFDFVLAGKHYVDEGYRTDNYNKRTRLNTNMRFRSKKIDGLAYGVNANFMGGKKTDFLLWSSENLTDTSGNDSIVIRPFQSMEGATNPNEGIRFNIDPFIYYYKDNGSRYSIRTRYYRVQNRIPTDSTKNNISEIYYGEYRYQTDIGDYTKIAAGGVNSYAEVESNLYGNHFSNNMAAYVQVDNDFGNLKTSVGVRGEYYRVDTTQTESMVDIKIGNKNMEIPVKPVFRAGANYRLAEYTNLRASFGQGYRFPSIAEKYTATAFAGMLNVFPNPRLESETGWNAEVGGRQGFRIGRDWKGFADISAFYSRYNNMMEFSFGYFDTETYMPLPDTVMPTADNVGFQSMNVGDVRITGMDFSVSASGEIFRGLDAILFAGYTYLNPVNLYDNEADKEEIYATKSRETDYLKYRYKHSVKGNVILEYSVFSAGVSMIYHSPVLAVDNIFVSSDSGEQMFNNAVLPGYTDYYAYNKYRPVLTWDMHAGWQMNENIKSSVVIRNLFNTELVQRPGNMMPPRSVSYQFTAKF
ncbi:MAG: TonB-dependent receptor [Bacteroidales bacterium]